MPAQLGRRRGLLSEVRSFSFLRVFSGGLSGKDERFLSEPDSSESVKGRLEERGVVPSALASSVK